MKKKKELLLLIALSVLVLVTLACEFSASTAEITNAYMSIDEDGNSPTTVFSGSDVFYCIVETAAAPSSTKIKAEWYAVNVDFEDVQPNTLLEEVEIEGSDIFTFSLSNDYLWPNGIYRVDLYLNGEFDSSVDFSVAE
jgi:ABC-type transport system substrate-binding protein